MKAFNAIALTFAVVLTAAAVGADEKKTIGGRYELVGGEENGKPAPVERTAGSLVVIDKDTIVGTDKDRKEFFSSAYTLDPSATPWKITTVSKSPKEGQKAEGVVKVEGESVWICYALPGGKTPTGFKTEEKQHCFQMKRSAK
ncbi:MAG: TIGR03067 domain-containing protein [Gemmataceae bacterium]